MKRLPTLALAFMLIGLSGSVPAAAATAQCIPAARFSTLARITDGSMSQLAELLGLPGKTPPADACRGILLSGPLTRGSAAALLTEVSRNKGWLTTVYIAVADGDLREEIEIARLMRDFGLAGRLMAGAGVYMPDFLVPPRTVPASVSNSWLQAEGAGDTPLTISFKDYLENTDRKIRPYPTTCGAGCWTILSGAVERGVVGSGRKAAGDDSAQSPEDARIRDAARLEFGAQVALVKQTAGYLPIPRMADRADVDRSDIDADCKPAIDYATTLASEIAATSDRFAKKRFPYMRLQPLQQKVRRFVEATGNAELCVRKVMTRLRMAAFAKQCQPTCEDRLKAVEDEAGSALARHTPPPATRPTGTAEPPKPPVASAPVATKPTETGVTDPDDSSADEAVPAGSPVLRKPQRRR